MTTKPTKVLSRRTLLRGGAALAAASAVAPLVTNGRAAPGPKNVILVLARGGWDPTYSLDPKPGLATVDAPTGTVQELSGIPILTDPSRPSVTEFFSRYGRLGAVINGIQVRSFIHADCMKRVLTGTASDQTADFGAITAFAHGRDLPVPYLVLGTSARSGPLASITGRAGTTNQLASLLAPPEYAPYDPFSPNVGFQLDEAERSLVTAYVTASAERLRATRGRGASNQRQIEAFLKSVERQGRLRAFAQTASGLGERVYTPDLDVQTSVAVSAIEGGLSHSAMLEFGDFDTHDANDEQSQLQEDLFAGLIGLTTELETRNLLDHTVVVVMSEMGRTPKLNDNLGKDHWPVTSAVVYGAGVRGGTAVGASDDGFGAVSVDLQSGAPGGSDRQLQTSNLVAGLLSLVGVDAEEHFPGVEPFGALVA